MSAALRWRPAGARAGARARDRGYTLIEQMIAVAILGIVLAGAGWGVYGTLSGPGRPGHLALTIERATEELVRAQQEMQATPFSQLAAQAGAGATPQPSNTPSVRLERTIDEAATGLLRIELVAHFRERKAERSLRLVALRGARQ